MCNNRSVIARASSSFFMEARLSEYWMFNDRRPYFPTLFFQYSFLAGINLISLIVRLSVEDIIEEQQAVAFEMKAPNNRGFYLATSKRRYRAARPRGVVVRTNHSSLGITSMSAIRSRFGLLVGVCVFTTVNVVAMGHRPFCPVGACLCSRSTMLRMNPLMLVPCRRSPSSLTFTGCGNWISTLTIFIDVIYLV